MVQIGGDGLFQEIMNGVLAVRSLGTEASAVLRNWRLGHIPAGSTDAVAYSINGTRSAATAALHIALGDRSPSIFLFLCLRPFLPLMDLQACPATFPACRENAAFG